MQGKTKLLLILSAFLLTMCRSYANQPITYVNGLSCKNYVDYRFFEWRGERYNFYLREEGADCTYTCEDGSVREMNVSGTISAVYSSSPEELEARFCGGASAPTVQPPLATVSATLTADLAPSATPTRTPTLPSASPTRTAAPAARDPLLTETISMCDLGGKLINFRIVQPPPDVTGRDLRVEIAERESACYVNPTNPSLLTCTIPNDIRFPARVVVTLDGALANDFVYSGVGCSILTTPTPAARPSYP